MYKVLNNAAPPYITQELERYVPGRWSLRSADAGPLLKPKTGKKALGEFDFAISGPRLWNELEKEIRTAPSLETFKKRLKTHLLKKSYPPEQIRAKAH